MNAIVAVVVTYNRCELLLRCLDHILGQQNASCDILVIDNASTDNTKTAVQAIGDPRITYLNTGENLGGAGGFHFGIKAAVKRGYSFLWVMDDDTLPGPDALKAFLTADSKLAGYYGWLSSQAFWTDGRICPMNVQMKSPYRQIAISHSPLIASAMASFVSLFLPARTVSRFGLPLREFFIWTDDWEYTRRISRQAPCYTVTASRVVHAMKSLSIVNIAADREQRLPRYRYFYRNDVYLYRREGLAGWCWVVAKFLWHSTQVLFRGKNKGLKLRTIWQGFISGIRFHPRPEFPRQSAGVAQWAKVEK